MILTCTIRSPPRRSVGKRDVGFLIAMLLAACSVKDSRQVIVTPQVVRTGLFVSPVGLDSNPGTFIAPLRTLARAAQLVTPGTTVNVLPGTYPGGFRSTVSGLPSARIVFRSTKRWQAHIVPPPLSAKDIAWDNRASYVDIEGFSVDGSGQIRGVRWTTGIHNVGMYNRIVENQVQHIAITLPCTSTDGSGIGVNSYYQSTYSQVTGNSVHNIRPPSCRYVHGIDFSTPGTVRNTVRNNILY